MTANTVETHMSPGGARPMAGAVQDVENSMHLSRCAGARAGRCQMMTQDAKMFTSYVTVMRNNEV